MVKAKTDPWFLNRHDDNGKLLVSVVLQDDETLAIGNDPFINDEEMAAGTLESKSNQVLDKTPQICNGTSLRNRESNWTWTPWIYGYLQTRESRIPKEWGANLGSFFQWLTWPAPKELCSIGICAANGPKIGSSKWTASADTGIRLRIGHWRRSSVKCWKIGTTGSICWYPNCLRDHFKRRKVYQTAITDWQACAQGVICTRWAAKIGFIPVIRNPVEGLTKKAVSTKNTL